MAEGRAEAAADHHEAVTVAVKQHSNPFNDDDDFFYYFIVCVSAREELGYWGYKNLEPRGRPGPIKLPMSVPSSHSVGKKILPVFLELTATFESSFLS